MKRWHWVVLIILAVIAIGGIWLWLTLTTFEVTKISGDVHVLEGAGGNVTILKTTYGTVVIDSMTFDFQGRKIRELAEELAGAPVKIVINTHYHGDHTHGNLAFDPQTRFIASENTAKYLRRCDADHWQDASGFPNELISGDTTLNVGNKTLQLSLPGSGHTGGDLVVKIVEDDVLVMGDLFFNNFYPNIDLEAGGSVQKWPATIAPYLSQAEKHVIPGHGKPAGMDALKQFHAFVSELAEEGQVIANKSEEEALELAKLSADKGYGVISVPFLLNLDRDFVVRRAWQETSGSVKAGGCP